MELPPYREMPPEVRFRLRSEVLPSLRTRSSPRLPYAIAAAIVVLAAVAVALFTGSDAAPPVAQHWTAPTAAPVVVDCRMEDGVWQAGAFLKRSNGDTVQLGIKDRGILGVCLLTSSHPTPSTWFTMVPWQPGHYWPTFQAVVSGGLVYGTIGPSVRSVTVDGAPATVANGTFVAEIDMKRSVTVATLDANGHVLDQATVS